MQPKINLADVILCFFRFFVCSHSLPSMVRMPILNFSSMMVFLTREGGQHSYSRTRRQAMQESKFPQTSRLRLPPQVLP